MIYRRLGRSGLKVSALSFGSWVTYGNQMGVDVARECMTAAY
ncbi:MAG: aldo/keto reductase, partial [Casimicrobiaceae bacterium]